MLPLFQVEVLNPMPIQPVTFHSIWQPKLAHSLLWYLERIGIVQYSRELLLNMKTVNFQ